MPYFADDIYKEGNCFKSFNAFNSAQYLNYTSNFPHVTIFVPDNFQTVDSQNDIW